VCFKNKPGCQCCKNCFYDRRLADFSLDDVAIPFSPNIPTRFEIAPGQTLVSRSPANFGDSGAYSWVSPETPHFGIDDSFRIRHLFGVQSHANTDLGSHNFLEVAKEAGKNEATARFGTATYDATEGTHSEAILDIRTVAYDQRGTNAGGIDSRLLPDICFGKWIWGRPISSPPLSLAELASNAANDVRVHVTATSVGFGVTHESAIEMIYADTNPSNVIKGSGIGLQYIESSLESPIAVYGAYSSAGATATKHCKKCARHGRTRAPKTPIGVDFPIHSMTLDNWFDLYDPSRSSYEFLGQPGSNLRRAYPIAISKIETIDRSANHYTARQHWRIEKLSRYSLTYRIEIENGPSEDIVSTLSISENGTLGIFTDFNTYEDRVFGSYQIREGFITDEYAGGLIYFLSNNQSLEGIMGENPPDIPLTPISYGFNLVNSIATWPGPMRIVWS
jgi:hypothetical protein